MELSAKKITLETLIAILGIVCVCVILGAALVMEYVYGEKPCPLCLLQRVAFINIGIALLMNLKYGNSVVHWGFVILSSVAGMAVSIRQILLHVNDPIGFGSAFLGLHMYTWCFIGYAIAIVGTGLLLFFYPKIHHTSIN